jgi:hypothetical protein
MKTHTLILPLLLLTAGTVPAAADTLVSSWELNRFIGSNLKGTAQSNLGIVSAANRDSGTVAVVGRHGELATVHTSMLTRAGMKLQAPTVSRGDIAMASYSGMNRVPLGGEPTIIIEEYSEYW